MTLQVEKKATLQGHTGSVYTLAYNAADNSVYSAGGDGMLVSWQTAQLASGKLIAKVPSHIFSILPLPKQKLMLLGQMQGGIHVLDMVEKKELKHLALHAGGVFDMALSTDGNHFLAAGGDGVLSSWNVVDQSLSKTISISDKSLRSICLSHRLSVIALGSSDGIIYLLDALYQVTYKLPGHTNSVFSTCFSPDGRYLLSGGRDAQLLVWDVRKNYELCRQIPAHLFTINSIVYHPEGHLIATASRDKTIKIWDAESFELLKVIDREKYGGHTHSVNKLLWMPDGALVSCSDDRNLMIWSINVK